MLTLCAVFHFICYLIAHFSSSPLPGNFILIGCFLQGKGLNRSHSLRLRPTPLSAGCVQESKILVYSFYFIPYVLTKEDKEKV